MEASSDPFPPASQAAADNRRPSHGWPYGSWRRAPARRSFPLSPLTRRPLPRQPWRSQPRSRRQRPGLHRLDRLGMMDDVAGDKPEGDLRGDEPSPINPGVERRVDDTQRGPDQRRPKQRREETSQEGAPARRQHRQQDREEQSDEYRERAVDDDREGQSRKIERFQPGKVRAGHRGQSGRGKQIDRIPGASIGDDPISASDKRHRDPAGYAALEPGRVGVNSRRDVNAVPRFAGSEKRYRPGRDLDRLRPLFDRERRDQFVLLDG